MIACNSRRRGRWRAGPQGRGRSPRRPYATQEPPSASFLRPRGRLCRRERRYQRRCSGKMRGRRVSTTSQLPPELRWKRQRTARNRRVPQGRLIRSRQETVFAFSWLVSLLIGLHVSCKHLVKSKNFASWRSAGALVLLRASRIEADERYECDDDDKKSDAGVDGAETQPAIGTRLGQQIAERGA